MNKTLKFRTELTDLITSGEKTATWRLFDDKNIQVGDMVDFLEFGTLKFIGTAKVVEVFIKKFKDLTSSDKVGHETYSSEEEMYLSFSNDYKTKVGPYTELKVIKYVMVENRH